VYLCRHFNLPEVADYWEQVVKLNDYQKHRFAKQIIDTLFNTVSGKKIAFLGWAFKKDTNDTRESAAIYVADELLQDHAEIHIYDPKVSKERIFADLEYLQSHRRPQAVMASEAKQSDAPETLSSEEIRRLVHVHQTPYSAMENAHAITVLTEWDEFRSYDWQKIYEAMRKPAFVFDGRNILNREELKSIGFELKGIGKE
jgi:UDPglucose 6-dehydrogenase